MQLKTKRSYNNSSRHKQTIQKNLLCKTTNIFKQLRIGYKLFGGRSSITGRITVRHKSAGKKKTYKLITYKNTPYFAITIGIAYDPNRFSFISLNFNFSTKTFFYTLAVHKVYAGALIICNSKTMEYRLGYKLALRNIPGGSFVNVLCSSTKIKSSYIKAAGTYGILLQRTKLFANIKLPSGIIKSFSPTFFATIGILANTEHNKEVLGKAGTNRNNGIRPSVRGIAMNPVDHPHGGRSNGGFVAVTPWGQITRGQRTKH